MGKIEQLQGQTKHDQASNGGGEHDQRGVTGINQTSRQQRPQARDAELKDPEWEQDPLQGKTHA